MRCRPAKADAEEVELRGDFVSAADVFPGSNLAHRIQ
jgi:hypothetical protein